MIKKSIHSKIESDMDSYIELLQDRYNYLVHNGANFDDRLWNLFLNNVRNGKIVLKNTSPKYVVDNVVFNSNWGYVEEYINPGEETHDFTDRLGYPLNWDKDDESDVVLWDWGI